MAEGQTSNPRQRLRVELRPGETTIVSWKKLLKEATAPKDNAPSAPPTVPSVVDAPVSDANEAQPTSRLSTVIERIERLYVGKASSDEEDLNDVVPDEDEYDTEDSFIDDAELDEYFQVDNSAIKHDGFFVNRGKLERIEPTELSNQQHKKRRRKDLSKDPDGLAVKNPNKHLKVGKKNEKPATFDGNHPSTASHVVALPSVRPEGVKLQDQVTAPEIPVKKKTTEAKNISLVSCTDESNVDGRRQEKVVIQQKQALGPSTNSVGEMSAQRSTHGQGKSPPVRPSKNVDEPEQTTKVLEFSSSHERPAISRPNGNKPVQAAGVHASQRKEGSSVRPRSTMLEKAIRDLEKMVAECRPPVSEVQDGENSSQSVKRRLPPEVKQKIAKVARLAQASHGKISKEVLNRLMSIVGHMIQLRSLKRNLKIMVNMGLSAKQEKDHRVQLIKGEVADMVQARIPLIKSKSPEQLGGMSNDFKEGKTEKIAALERNYSMDCTLEDKICDLYDLYVEGLEADAGPHVRKLYAELAAFWPSGLMDNHGIKRAICRAKDRKRPLQSQNFEKVKKKKKALVQKPGGIKSKVEASPPAQSLHTGPSNQGLSENKLISSKTAATSTSQMPGSTVGVSGSEKSKQEKMKGTLGGPGDANKTELIARKPTMTPDLEQSDEIACSHEESENRPKEGMIKRQHLTASMLNQLFET